MKYDYLIVGAGLFGSVFAYEMKKEVRSAWSLRGEAILQGTYIVKKWKASRYIDMAPIFFTHRMKGYGII